MLASLPVLESVEEIYFLWTDVSDWGVRTAVRRFPNVRLIALNDGHALISCDTAELLAPLGRVRHVFLRPDDPNVPCFRARLGSRVVTGNGMGAEVGRWWGGLRRDWLEGGDP